MKILPDPNDTITPDQITELDYLSTSGDIRYFWRDADVREFLAVNQDDLVIARCVMTGGQESKQAIIHVQNYYRHKGIEAELLWHAEGILGSQIRINNYDCDVISCFGNSEF